MDLFAPVSHIDHFLEAFLHETPMPTNLRDSCLYALLGGGKRLRPLLAWHVATACGGTGPASLPAGAAVEFVHAFSLAHDDLPALDNDDLRRGKPTLHKHAGEAMAILAGDMLLTLAFQIVAENAAPSHIAPLTRELAIATSSMISGQIYDTLGGFAPNLPDSRKVDLVHANKTGALITASCVMGAITAHASPAQIEAVTRYSQAIGLMFQIVDDLIDVEQSAEHSGKKTGKDAALGKLTYPAVHGVQGSRARVVELRENAHAALAQLPNPAPLAAIAVLMADRTK